MRFTSKRFTAMAALVAFAGLAGTAAASTPTDAMMQRIAPGLTAKAVLEILGPPDGRSRFESLGVTTWNYHYRDPWSYSSEFSVAFDNAWIVVGRYDVREGD